MDVAGALDRFPLSIRNCGTVILGVRGITQNCLGDICAEIGVREGFLKGQANGGSDL